MDIPNCINCQVIRKLRDLQYHKKFGVLFMRLNIGSNTKDQGAYLYFKIKTGLHLVVKGKKVRRSAWIPSSL